MNINNIIEKATKEKLELYTNHIEKNKTNLESKINILFDTFQNDFFNIPNFDIEIQFDLDLLKDSIENTPLEETKYNFCVSVYFESQNLKHQIQFWIDSQSLSLIKSDVLLLSDDDEIDSFSFSFDNIFNFLCECYEV